MFFEGAGLQSRAEHSREGRADIGVKIRKKDYACLDFMKVCKTFLSFFYFLMSKQMQQSISNKSWEEEKNSISVS
jgi:hypothetical protein